jgi:hypothetical protein
MSRATRVTDPSYELMDDHNGLSIIYRQHGFPCPLVRWHFHKEYELHLIVASSGKVFIGDYIGNFHPQSLFLTGPNLPHNWISQVAEDEVVAKRDMLVNFTDELFDSAYQVFAELKTLAPLLERAVRHRISLQAHDRQGDGADAAHRRHPGRDPPRALFHIAGVAGGL